MAENFPNLGERVHIQIEEAQRIPNKRNLKTPNPRYFISKLSKAKDKKAAKEKQLVMFNGNTVRLQGDFFCINFICQVWHDIVKVLKEKKNPNKNTLTKLFRIGGEMKFSR